MLYRDGVLKNSSFRISLLGLIMAFAVYLLLEKLEAQQKSASSWETANSSNQIEWVWSTARLGVSQEQFMRTLARYIDGDVTVAHSDVIADFNEYKDWFRSLDIFKLENLAEILDSPFIGEKELQGLVGSSNLADELRQLAGQKISSLEQKIPYLQRNDQEFLKYNLADWQPLVDQREELDNRVIELLRNSHDKHHNMEKELRAQLIFAYQFVAGMMVFFFVAGGFYLRQKILDNRNLTELNQKLKMHVAEKSQYADEMRKLAHHDSLSKLLNRTGFHLHLERVFREGDSHGLVFLDLDRFKIVNDTVGHTAGDKLIAGLGVCIESFKSELSARFSDSEKGKPIVTAARYGGDEFVVLFSNCSNEEFRVMAHSLLQDILAKRIEFDGRQLAISASLGACYFDSSTTSEVAVMASADSACYEAKRLGGSRLRFFQADHKMLEVRQTDFDTVNLIHHALANNRLCLFYQRLVELNPESSRLDSVEFLLRFLDTDGTPLSPFPILTVAEKYGLMTRIDMWVVNAAIHWLKSHPLFDIGLDHVNINLSALSISDDEFIEEIVAVLHQNPELTDQIYFEITETAAMHGNAIANLTALKSAGVGLALDDFGTGFSSFSYLESLPVDYIKIDGSFVRDLETNQIHQKFINSIVTVAKAMGKRTVAEFVENEQIVQILQRLGVDAAQGYHIGRPAPLIEAKDMVQCIENQRRSFELAEDDESQKLLAGCPDESKALQQDLTAAA